MIANQVFCNKNNYSFFKDNGNGYNENVFWNIKGNATDSKESNT